MKDLVTWISPEKFAGVLAKFGSAVMHRKGLFCSFKNLLKRMVPLDSSRETMQCGLLICPVWSSDGFSIAFQNYSYLYYFIISFISFNCGGAKCHPIIELTLLHLFKPKLILNSISLRSSKEIR